MKFSHDYPPNIAYFRLFYPNLEEYNPVFCYGDTIYNPFNQPLPPDIIVHEKVHSRQQGDDPELWYHNYFTDPKFRLSQELEAYQAQYSFFDRNSKDRELKFHFLNMLAEALASALYGNLVSLKEARNLIRG